MLFLIFILICIIFEILDPSLNKTSEGSLLLFYNNILLKDKTFNKKFIRNYIKIW